MKYLHQNRVVSLNQIGRVNIEINYQEVEADALPGAFSSYDMELLVPEVQKIPDGGCYVEIGVDQGRSLQIARQFAKPSVEVYGFDLRVDPKVKGTIFTQIDSVEGAKNFKKKIDVLFIDGDHTYEGCRRDIEAWYPHMKPGGVMLFHDHDESSPGVVWAVSEFYYTKGGASYTTFKLSGKNTNMARIYLYGGDA